MSIPSDSQHDAETHAEIEAALPAVNIGLTHTRADGNRLARGQGRIPQTAPLDLPLAGTPVWVVAAPFAAGTVWVVALEDGQLQAFAVEGRRVTALPVTPSHLPPGMPPLIHVEGDGFSIVPIPPDASPLTHPVLVGEGNLLAYAADNGDFVLTEADGGGERARFAVAALPDARILVDEQARLLLLAGATPRYDHGVLGDAIEASTVVMVESLPQPRIALTLTIPALQVIEGIAPLWADVNGDGVREILVTLSDRDEGARVMVYSEEGQLLAAGPPVGQGFRWRHQLAVAPFGPAGEVELVEVITPHIGGIANFSRVEGDQLVAVARHTGHTSHMLGSRNLDMAVAGDFDGDGALELLLPDNGFQALGALRRTEAGVDVAWSVAIGGRLSTNLATTQSPDGTLVVGVGRTDATLRIWLGE